MARKDDVTLELPGVARRPGRPRSGQAMTGAERSRAWRRRRALIEAGDKMPATIKRLADQFDMTVAEVTRELLRWALCNRAWSKLGFPSHATETETADSSSFHDMKRGR